MTHHHFTNHEFQLKRSQDRHQYHTLRYDFKPQSVNSDESAAVELTQNGQVTIKAPNIGGSTSKYTVFKGQRRPHVKECLLVLDNRTGEMVLQKLTDNITVKATRALGGGSVGAVGASNGTTLSSTTLSNNNNTNANNNNNNNNTVAITNNHQHHHLQNNHTNHNINNNAGSSNNNNNHVSTDGPQLSEESSSSSDDDDDSSDSSSSSSTSSDDSQSGNSSPSNDEGFTF